MKPTENLLYWRPGRYVNAAATDLRKTFARIKREQLRERVAASGLKETADVLPIKARR